MRADPGTTRARAGRRNAVCWLGRCRRAGPTCSAPATGCVPSRNEPFGIIVLEAWAAGKPVVASQIGGPGELIWHAINGLKIYPNPDSVGWGLGTVFTNWDWARRMGRYGRVDAETAFSWDRIAEQTERCYQS
jgi:glycosyltransferase involved in cell wall biosynthesis